MDIKRAADGGKTTIANQGQAMDGYSELAAYRHWLEKAIDLDEDEDED